MQHCLVAYWYIPAGISAPGTDIPAGLLNSLTDDWIEVERKFEEPQILPRLGTVVLVGQDYPIIDTSAAGVSTRLIWLHESQSKTTLSTAERGLLLSDAGINYLRYWLLYEASQIYQGIQWPEHDPTLEDTGLSQAIDVRSQLQDPRVLLLREAFKAERDGFVAAADISDILKTAEEPVPAGKAMRALLVRAFPDITTGRYAGTRGWRGIAAVI